MSKNNDSKYTLLDNTLAHLAMGDSAPTDKGIEINASIEELVKLAKGELSSDRKHEILFQLEHDEHLYRLWMSIPHSYSADSKSPEAQTKSFLESIFEKIRLFLESFISWQSAVTLAFGVLFGIFITMNKNQQSDSFVSYEIAQISPPIEAPMKASVGSKRGIDLNQLHKCAAISFNDNSGELCISNSQNIQNWYWIEGQSVIKPIPKALTMLELIDVQSDRDLVSIIYHKNSAIFATVFSLENQAGNILFNERIAQLITKNSKSEVAIASFKDGKLSLLVNNEIKKLYVGE